MIQVVTANVGCLTLATFYLFTLLVSKLCIANFLLMLLFKHSQFIISFFVNFFELHFILIVNLWLHLTKFLLASTTVWSFLCSLALSLVCLVDYSPILSTTISISRRHWSIILFLVLIFRLWMKKLHILIFLWRGKSSLAHLPHILLVVTGWLVVHLTLKGFIQNRTTMVCWFFHFIICTTLIFFKLFVFVNLTCLFIAAKDLVVVKQIVWRSGLWFTYANFRSNSASLFFSLVNSFFLDEKFFFSFVELLLEQHSVFDLILVIIVFSISSALALGLLCSIISRGTFKLNITVLLQFS